MLASHFSLKLCINNVIAMLLFIYKNKIKSIRYVTNSNKSYVYQYLCVFTKFKKLGCFLQFCP